MRGGGLGGAGAVLVAFVVAFATSACGERPAISPTTTIEIPLRSSTYRLPNGLTIVLEEDHRAPNVAVNIAYRVGSKDDPKGRGGLAHFVEHLMFDGSRHVKKGEFASRLEGAGAQSYNAATSRDRTVYHETIPAEQVALALWLESDRMGFFGEEISPEEFARERDVVKNEWRERDEDHPFGFVDRFVQEALFPVEHPYHHSPIGSPAELDAVTLDEAKAFHARYYAPANATLSIVGDFRAPEVLHAVEKYFGDLPARAVAEPSRADAPTLARDVHLVAEAPFDDRRLIVAWMAPPQFSREEPKVHVALDTVEGLLHYWLVTQAGLARSVAADYEPGLLGGVAELHVVLEPNARLPDVLKMIDSAVSDGAQTEVSRRWIAIAEGTMTTDLLLSYEEIGERAELNGLYSERFGDAHALARLVRRYDAVSRGEMEDAKAKYFAAHRVTLLIRPNDDAPVAGRLMEGESF